MYTEKKRTKFLALPVCFTTYRISEEKINIKRGLFSTTEDECYMYKVQDVRLVKSLMERIFGLGTIHCYTGDTTDKELTLAHIKNSDEIKDYLMEQSEEARLRRRTLHTMDINTHGGYDDIED